MNEFQFFAKATSASQMTPVFAADTTAPGVIHARVLFRLAHGLVDEALALVRSRADVVQESTYELLASHPASRHLFAS